MTSKWNALRELGQSVWYDNVARPALDSGLLAKLMAEDNVTGGTSNPSIFANAVSEVRPVRRRHQLGARRRHAAADLRARGRGRHHAGPAT